MPVHIEHRGDKYRLVEPNGKIAMTPQGHARDGGGHESRKKAGKQARAINSSLSKCLWRLHSIISKGHS